MTATRATKRKRSSSRGHARPLQEAVTVTPAPTPSRRSRAARSRGRQGPSRRISGWPVSGISRSPRRSRRGLLWSPAHAAYAHRVLLAAADALERRVGRPAVRTAAVAGLRRRLDLRLVSPRRHAPHSHRVPRGVAQERQVDACRPAWRCSRRSSTRSRAPRYCSRRLGSRLGSSSRMRDGLCCARPALGAACPGQHAIADLARASRLEPISKETPQQHGFNASVAIIDEIHARRRSELLDIMQSRWVPASSRSRSRSRPRASDGIGLLAAPLTAAVARGPDAE